VVFLFTSSLFGQFTNQWSEPGFTINVTGNDPCFSDYIQILEIVEDFEEYRWYFENNLVSTGKTFATDIVGEVRVTVSEPGCCSYSQTITLDNPLENSLQIDASGMVICQTANPIQLEVDATLNNITWRNSEYEIVGNSHILLVAKAGTYSVVASNAEGCLKHAEITITSPFGELSLTQEKRIVCQDGNEITLSLENIPSDVGIVWSNNSVGVNEIQVGPGDYSVTVTMGEGPDACDWVGEVTVLSDLPEDLQQLFIDNGFTCVPYQYLSGLKPNSNGGLLKTLTCDPDFNQANLIDHNYEINVDGNITTSYEYVQDLLNENCECGTNTGAILMSDFCADPEYTVDRFLSFDEQFADGAIQVFINHDIFEDCMWVKNPIPPETCIPQIRPNFQKFSNFLNEILCAKKDGRDLFVAYEGERAWHSQTLDKMSSGGYGQRPFFDGHIYRGNLGGSNVGLQMTGVHKGKILNLSTPHPCGDGIAPYRISDINYSCYDNLFWEREFNGPSIEIGIMYTDGTELVISAHGEWDVVAFERLFENTQQIVNDKIADFLTTNESSLLDRIPSCYIDDSDESDLCSLLFLLQNGINERLSTPNIIAFLNLTNVRLMNPNNIQDKALSIINCVKDNYLIPLYVDDAFRSRKDKVDLFKRLYELYAYNYSPTTPTNEAFNWHIGGGSIFGYGYTYSNDYTFNENENSFDYFNSELTIKLLIHPFTPIVVPIKRDFDYFNNHVVRLDNSTAFIKDIKQTQNGEHVNYKMPGLYIAYATERYQLQQDSEDIELALDLATIAVGFGQLSAAVKAGRIAYLSGAFGGADIVSGTVGVFLHESSLCEGSGISSDFCDKYGKVLDIANTILLTGILVPSQVSKLNAASDAFEAMSVSQKLNFWDELVSTYGVEEAIRVLKLLGNETEDILKIVFKDIHSIDFNITNTLFADLASISDVNKLIELEMAIKVMDPAVGLRLFRDINETKFLAGKIGNDLVNLTEGQVKAWDDLLVRNVPDALRVNTKFLGRLSDNPKLVNYVDNLTDAGKNSLANNVDEWIKHYDVRIDLKNGDVGAALSKLEGTLGTPFTGPNGVKYIDEALSTSGNSSAVYTKYDNIVADNGDVSLIAQRLQAEFPGSNLSDLEQIVGNAKQHLFVNEQLVPVGNGVWKQGRFSPQEFIADDWLKVRNGTHNSEEINNIRKLIAHEYIESKLMIEGIPFRGRNVDPSPTAFGAHDLSVNEKLIPDFSHYSGNGLNPPGSNVNSNFSNIDEVVDQIKIMVGL